MIEKLTKRRPRSVVFSLTRAFSRSPLRHFRFPSHQSLIMRHASPIYLRRRNHSMVLLFTNNQLNSHRCAKGGRRYPHMESRYSTISSRWVHRAAGVTITLTRSCRGFALKTYCLHLCLRSSHINDDNAIKILVMCQKRSQTDLC